MCQTCLNLNNVSNYLKIKILIIITTYKEKSEQISFNKLK